MCFYSDLLLRIVLLLRNNPFSADPLCMKLIASTSVIQTSGGIFTRVYSKSRFDVFKSLDAPTCREICTAFCTIAYFRAEVKFN
jgi:hypothetical protein